MQARPPALFGRAALLVAAVLSLSCAVAVPAEVLAPLAAASPGASPVAVPSAAPTAPGEAAPVPAPEGGYPTPDPGARQLQVARVVDGDTIQLVEGGKRFSVRLIGIDTPETVHPSKGVECYGPEASAFVKGLLTGKVVAYGTDPTQGETDKYGRGLGYVWFEGRLVNQEIVQRGLGREYTYAKPYRYQREFRAAEASARAAGLGLWSGACPQTFEFKTRTEPLDGPALIDLDAAPDAPLVAPSIAVSLPAVASPEPYNPCGPGMVWVDGYTRKDGRSVKGYCRRR